MHKEGSDGGVGDLRDYCEFTLIGFTLAALWDDVCEREHAAVEQ